MLLAAIPSPQECARSQGGCAFGGKVKLLWGSFWQILGCVFQRKPLFYGYIARKTVLNVNTKCPKHVARS